MCETKIIAIEKKTLDRLDNLRGHLNRKGVIKGVIIADDTTINYLLNYYYEMSDEKNKKRLCQYDAMVQFLLEYQPLSKSGIESLMNDLKNIHFGKDMELKTIC